jgi:hypothetical protein
MTPTSQLLRDGIRNGTIQCECVTIIGHQAVRLGNSQHFPTCRWAGAIAEIYHLERLDEGIVDSENLYIINPKIHA